MIQRDILGSKRSWLWALPFALGVDVIILSLIYYWFAAADRYIVFLYEHDMGPYVPDTSPFSPVTSSRYWMAGLVAAGAVLVLYVVSNWLLGRLKPNYDAPDWWRVWSLSSPALLIGIPLITMTQNEPLLPFNLALRLTSTTIIALALSLAPGKMAVRDTWELVWLALDGLGLMLFLLGLPGLQFLSRWLENGQTIYVVMLVGSAVSGLLWLVLMSGFRLLRRFEIPRALKLLLAGFALAYLVMPLLHHLVFTDGYYYITDSDNFFARNPLLQLFIWLIALVIAYAITYLRRSVSKYRAAYTNVVE